MLADFMQWGKARHNLISSSMTTGETIVLEGWVPTKNLRALRTRIENKTDYYALEELETPQDEIPPVAIENSAFIQPFESITRLYGLPSYSNLDPTVFLAGFFFIFFGLSLTDVGYGFVLIALTASALYFYKPPPELRPFIKLILYGGVASVIAGLFFGGYLGVDVSLLPAWLQAIQTFDPIASPMPVLYFALSLGVVQILFGLILDIVRASKNGEFMDGLLDKGPWILIFLSLILFGGNALGFFAGDSTYYVWGIYAALLSLVTTQGRKEKSLLKKALKGITSLYDSIGYFSDVLSYSRLLALGLATSALAFAVNLIASMVEGVPYIGFVLVIAILLIGHTFNLAVNVLGAFIHSARLQFVEFFGKFITGSGTEFKPFARDERHVVIENT